MNAIVLSFDRLPLSFLACYGNNWIETPNFDRFAAQAATFHQHFSESLWLDTVRHAWWSGCYECRRRKQAQPRDLLPAALATQGVTVRLLLETGDPADSSAKELSGLFPDCTESIAGTDGLEVAPDDTPFLRLIGRAQRDLRMLRTSRSEPWLLWIKSGGVPTPWLAPADYARLFLDIDDDDPADDESLEAADEFEEEEEDVDLEELDVEDASANDGRLLELSDSQFEELLRSASRLPPGRKERDAMTDLDRALTRKVLGGYLALLDTGVGRLLETIDQSASGAPALVLITAAQGLTVHEPGVLRDEWEPAAEETVHVPLMIRGAGLNRGVRRQTLTQPVDIFPTLLEWFGLERPDSGLDGHSLLAEARGDQSDQRALAFATDGDTLKTVRTPDHYFVQKCAANSEEPQQHLFAKPEDAWEVNDLASQLPGLVEDLAEECARFFVNERDDAAAGGER
ncbi:MAG TPA: sulfatase-like hydrolase/transferase [Planctomycetaceae bacterium]|jgi:arylsulfatase A-like enzyme|nr:sulfatase-like hydrolase/transferase [Planctomycetaceae bacterium]